MEEKNTKQQIECEVFMLQGIVVAIKTAQGKWLCTFCKNCRNEFDTRKQFVSHFAEWHISDIAKPAKW